MKAILYVHGKGGSYLEAEQYKEASYACTAISLAVRNSETQSMVAEKCVRVQTGIPEKFYRFKLTFPAKANKNGS